jgi:hypothetical protein
VDSRVGGAGACTELAGCEPLRRLIPFVCALGGPAAPLAFGWQSGSGGAGTEEPSTDGPVGSNGYQVSVESNGPDESGGSEAVHEGEGDEGVETEHTTQRRNERVPGSLGGTVEAGSGWAAFKSWHGWQQGCPGGPAFYCCFLLPHMVWLKAALTATMQADGDAQLRPRGRTSRHSVC